MWDATPLLSSPMSDQASRPYLLHCCSDSSVATLAEDCATFVLSEGTGDTFHAMLYIALQPPTIPWEIIVREQHFPIIKMILEYLKPPNMPRRVQLLSVADRVGGPISILAGRYINIPVYYGIEGFISIPALYHAWLSPLSYPRSFNSLPYARALGTLSKQIDAKVMSNCTHSCRHVVAIYPESGATPGQDLVDVQGFWKSIIDQLSAIAGGQYIYICNSNPTPFHSCGNSDFGIKNLDLSLDALIALGQLGCQINILGFRSGIHDLTRCLSWCNQISIVFDDGSPGSFDFLREFDFDFLGSCGNYLQIPVNASAFVDASCIARVIASKVLVWSGDVSLRRSVGSRQVR